MSDKQPAAQQVDPALAADTDAPTPPQDVPSQLVETQKPSLFARIAGGSIGLSIGAALAAFIVGGLLIAVTDPATQAASRYFFARPLDTLAAGWSAAYDSYVALLQGSIFNPNGRNFTQQIRPLTETLTVATPLIFAGLAVALSFRAGLFNIGAQGQIILGAIVSGWVALNAGLPVIVMVPLILLGGIVGGAIWGGIIGVLKARTGAHEVILSIMMNYIAANLLVYLLKTPLLQREGSSNPISEKLGENALFPLLLGPQFRLHAGFLAALLAVAFVWWLLNSSTVGFRLRAVGANPNAARTAGISVASGYIVVMALSGALAGLAGAAQVAGTEKVLSTGIAASLGFDAITVALLGRSKPVGTFFAALLYGAFRAGGVSMQVSTGTDIDIVLVLQALIVLFIAAPPLVRAIFRLPDPTGAPRTKKKKSASKAVEAAA
ncbi:MULTISPECIES: ABC transporter permease [Rothia]|uniref:ABC transporter permease n=1 Tax=Rothia endophytica TaxID=1324766 RepID=A0ABP9BL14_9MICC|nr:ABC transporter permease [Rothia sp. P100]MCM3511028.1 ABC transporter permease [Rothia sp. P100]SLE33643.1 Galactoside transport system permease protein mglC [Mycobacteroides abscessus subsp. bolletii]